jgi:hypothetical protein
VTHTIVFSRDRAAQLDLLLTSLRENAPALGEQLSVLWTATDDAHREAYARCSAEHPEASFVAESCFADDVRSLLAASKLVVFLTDDSVLFRPLAERRDTPQQLLEADPQLLCFSLRLGRNCEYCYPVGREQERPSFEQRGDVLSWSWRGADGDFAYPMSLDGHLMEAALVRGLLGAEQPVNPNQLEGLLADAAKARRLPERMASYADSHLVSIPVNRVNETHPNRSADTADPGLLNERYLAGDRLALEAIDFAPVDAAHAELDLRWRGAAPAVASESVCLVAVVRGATYERFAQELFVSARRLFRPTGDVEMMVLPGVPGWPAATLYRYHVLAQHLPQLRHDYVFMVDADMLVEAPVGPEILAPLVATRHPGYVETVRDELPYERSASSAAQVREGEGVAYYAGGFVGGAREHVLDLAQRIAANVDLDERRGVVARWHDESHLNRCLIDTPPFLELSPAYCHPDDDAAYRAVWRERYPRRLVAVDKRPEERPS